MLGTKCDTRHDSAQHKQCKKANWSSVRRCCFLLYLENRYMANHFILFFFLRWWRRWDCGRSGSLVYSTWTVKATSPGSSSIRRSVFLCLNLFLHHNHHNAHSFLISTLALLLSLLSFCLVFFILCQDLSLLLQSVSAVVWTLTCALLTGFLSHSGQYTL